MADPSRRFYKQAAARADGGVALDERGLRTPGGAPFVAPTSALAALIATEWDAQGEHIAPATMPLTQLAFAAIDWTCKRRSETAAYVASFGATDLCCHRAVAPADLAARQAEYWDPLVAWGCEALEVDLPIVTGVIAAPVGEETLTRLRDRAASLDDFRLTALGQSAGLAGSVLIAFALLRGRLTAQQAYTSAMLDNLWSLEKWGEDDEARARLNRQHAEFETLSRFIDALNA